MTGVTGATNAALGGAGAASVDIDARGAATVTDDVVVDAPAEAATARAADMPPAGAGAVATDRADGTTGLVAGSRSLFDAAGTICPTGVTALSGTEGVVPWFGVPVEVVPVGSAGDRTGAGAGTDPVVGSAPEAVELPPEVLPWVP